MIVCPECGVELGNWHRPGCSWAQCPYCGDHLADCDHEPPLDDQLPWAGFDFWLDACLELGLFRRETPEGWVPCLADEADSVPDVRRLFREFVWSREEKDFVPRGGP